MRTYFMKAAPRQSAQQPETSQDESIRPDDRFTVTEAGRDLLERRQRRAPDVDVMPNYEDMSQEEIICPPEQRTVRSHTPTSVDRRRSG